MTIAIEARGVSKRYLRAHDRAHSLKERFVRRGRATGKDDFWALRGVDLDIESGSFHGLIGHNGSGKSTLLKLLAGIHRPTEGTLEVRGRVAALLELGSGFHPELTGRENIYLNAAILGIGRRQMGEVIDEVIEFSGIGEFIDAPVKVLSSGMYVRLGFAVSVHVRPEVLLVDEVIAVGDEEFQRKCLEHLYELRRAGTTIVLVSHSIPLVEALCDTVTWLDHGRVVTTGSPGEVCNAYLAAVNQQELDRADAERAAAGEVDADAPPAEPIPVNADGLRRRGTGEVRLEGLEFFDKQGNPHPIAGCGDPLRVRIWHRTSEPVPDASVRVLIHHPNGITVAAPSTVTSGFEIGPLETGVAHIDLIIDRVPLLPGEYALTFEIRDRSQSRVFDAWEHAEILRVQPGSSPERAGLVDLAARWEKGSA